MSPENVKKRTGSKYIGRLEVHQAKANLNFFTKHSSKDKFTSESNLRCISIRTNVKAYCIRTESARNLISSLIGRAQFGL